MTDFIDPSEEHAARVGAVSAQVRARPPGKLLTVRKSSPSHTVRDRSYKERCHPIDLDGVDRILEIDTSARLARVEGQVSMGALVRRTLELGFVPEVVPEFSSFTVAGLVNGEGIQSSSHRYGLFSSTVRRLEVVLADGSVRVLDAESDPELFEAFFSSHGTLGFVTGAEIGLVPARAFVRSTYRMFSSRAGYVQAFNDGLDKSAFVEGVVYGPREHLLIESDFADDPGGAPVYHPAREGNPYYFQHARGVAKLDAGPAYAAIPSYEYLFRGMRGLWWMTECTLGLPFVTNSRWGRKLVDRAIDRAMAAYGFNAPDLTVEERERCLVHQDMGIRPGRLHETLDYVDRELRVNPIWNCALKLNDKGKRQLGETYIVDVGIYGEPKVGRYENRRQMRALQQFVDAPSLWGVSYLTREEIRSANVYDYDVYERVREACGAREAFMHLDDKVVWMDFRAKDLGKIPLWRLYRDYGKHWPFKALVKLGGGRGRAGSRSRRVQRADAE